jgi:FKBP-type peptidyl-prolyl cis-trans isomerase
MNLRSGIKLLKEIEGEGEPAKKGDKVIYNLKIFLNKGDEVLLNQMQTKHLPKEMIRDVDGYQFVDHKTRLGTRDAIAGVEYTLTGMKEGGYRKVRVSPHLGYREKGLPGLIPSGAVLIMEVWLREIAGQ